MHGFTLLCAVPALLHSMGSLDALLCYLLQQMADASGLRPFKLSGPGPVRPNRLTVPVPGPGSSKQNIARSMAPLWRVSVSWVGPEPQAAKEPHWLQVHTHLSLRSTVIKRMATAAGHWTVHWTVSEDTVTVQCPAGRVLPKYFLQHFWCCRR